jgi:aspartyl aminopeptidase
VGAHTDSPTFAVRPIGDVSRAGYRLLGVEPYGGLLAHTWLDRDLTLAGRVVVRDGSGEAKTRLVHLPGAPLRIPNLAIHLYRELREEGLKLDPQRTSSRCGRTATTRRAGAASSPRRPPRRGPRPCSPTTWSRPTRSRRRGRRR